MSKLMLIIVCVFSLAACSSMPSTYSGSSGSSGNQEGSSGANSSGPYQFALPPDQ